MKLYRELWRGHVLRTPYFLQKSPKTNQIQQLTVAVTSANSSQPLWK